MNHDFASFVMKPDGLLMRIFTIHPQPHRMTFNPVMRTVPTNKPRFIATGYRLTTRRVKL
ncbi:hypothetical protein MJO29_004019 [Puccinia striiformis f. sp. tritici]|nr:hypothetical protein MJO29_004019 [Puccinia striiformis f. sp. tritici]